jgi:hypothetical protein
MYGQQVNFLAALNFVVVGNFLWWWGGGGGGHSKFGLALWTSAG